MKYHDLGQTGLKVSIIAFGGIMLENLNQEEADKAVEYAVDRGINLFDVGPTYGTSEEKLGSALAPYRDDVVLACKTEPDNTKDEVRSDMENSLKLFKTDHFELYQLHEVTDEKSLQKALNSGGALEAIIEAKKEGIVDNIGFSAHSEWAAKKLMKAYDFDTVMFPVNWNYWLNFDEGEKIVERAREKNMGMLAIKVLAHRRWQEDDDKNDFITWYKPVYENKELAELALKFTLSRDIDSAISPGDIRLLKTCVEHVENNKRPFTLTDSEEEKLKDYVEKEEMKLYPIPD